MARPLTDEEREEIDNLVAECDGRTDRLRALLTELVRSRSFVRVARAHRGELRPSLVRRAFERSLPDKSAELEWIELLARGELTEDDREPELPF